MRKAFLLVLVSLMFTSCLSTMFAPTEYVRVIESPEEAERRIYEYRNN